MTCSGRIKGTPGFVHKTDKSVFLSRGLVFFLSHSFENKPWSKATLKNIRQIQPAQIPESVKNVKTRSQKLVVNHMIVLQCL